MAPRPKSDPPDADNTQRMTKYQRDRLSYLLRTYGHLIPENEFKRLMELRAGEKAGEFSLTRTWGQRAIEKIERYTLPKGALPPQSGGSSVLLDFWHLPEDARRVQNAINQFKARAKAGKSVINTADPDMPNTAGKRVIKTYSTQRALDEALAQFVEGIVEKIRAERADMQPGKGAVTTKIMYTDDKGTRRSVSVAKDEVSATMARLRKEGASKISTKTDVTPDGELAKTWNTVAQERIAAEKANKPARSAAAREKMQKQARIASGKSQRYTGGPSPSKAQTAALNRAYNAGLKKLMTEFDKAGGAGTPDPATLPKGVVIAGKGKAKPMDKAMRGIIERAIVAAGDGLTPEQRNKLLSVLVWNEAGVVNVDDQWASAAVDKLNNIVDQVDKTRVKPTTVKVGSKTVSTKTKSQKAYSPTRTPEEQAAIKQDIETRRNTRRNEAVKEAKGAIRDVFGSEPVVRRAPAAPAEPAAPQKVRITYRLDGKQGVATVELDKADAWVAGLKEDGAKGIKIEQIKTDAPVAGGAKTRAVRDAATREKLILANEQKAAGSKTGGGGRRAGGKPPTRDAGFIDFGQMLRNRRTSGAAPALPKFSTPSGARIIRPSRPLMQTGGIRGVSGVEGLMLGGMSGMAAQNSSSYVPGLTGKQFGGGSQQRAGKK